LKQQFNPVEQPLSSIAREALAGRMTSRYAHPRYDWLTACIPLRPDFDITECTEWAVGAPSYAIRAWTPSWSFGP